MYKRLPAGEKKKLIDRALKGGEQISSICEEVKISRTIFYRWLKIYSTFPSPSYLEMSLRGGMTRQSQSKNKRSPRPDLIRTRDDKRTNNSFSFKSRHPKAFSLSIINKIVKTAVENPHISVHEIAKLSGVSSHGAWKVLKNKNLNTVKSREEYLNKNGASLVKEVDTEVKLKIIKRYETGESVASLCNSFGVSRTIFYRWLKRYREQGRARWALESQRPKKDKHWRNKPEAKELILQIIIDNPELSVHKLAKVLYERTGKKILGVHGIHNLLVKLDLNYMEKRIAYANSHTPSVFIPPVAMASSIPQAPRFTFISYLPPPVRYLISSYGPLFAASFLISLIGIIYISTIVSSGSISGAIGVTFAWLALILGSFFFIYSIKYYITIAVVLSFSRRQLDASMGESPHSFKSFWGRLFGVEITIEDPSRLGKQIEKPRLGLQHDLSGIRLERQPFVSIQLSTYNEKRVINRLLTAATSMDYPNFEVIIADDSNDETVTLIEEFVNEWNSKHTSVDKNNHSLNTHHPVVKISRRESRDGYKGGALREALKITDPKAEYILIFDADFIPYPDTITSFLKYFQYTAGSLNFTGTKMQSYKDAKLRNNSETMKLSNSASSNIAAVQGYQWHVLNKSENWITRGVRSEYAGSYVIERSGAEVYGGLKQISGSVYMIRRDALESIGWGTSITEDFELTLRLYEKGWKVVYTPYIQSPAEAVGTLKRLIRQRMRWAEGHSFNIKRMFWRLMRGHWEPVSDLVHKESIRIQDSGSSKQEAGIKHSANILASLFMNHDSSDKEKVFIRSPLTLTEKLELLYLTPYYLQAAFFILGTISWLISETVFRVRLPFWTEIWGWSLVLTNLFALPLMNMVGLFMEESDEKDYVGLFSFIALSYIVAPFQAYAAIKGFMEDKEGPWFRTPKTGRITDIFVPGRFVRIFSGIFGRPAGAMVNTDSKNRFAQISGNHFLALLSLPSIHNITPFNLSRARKQRKRIGNIFLILLISLSLIVSSLTPYVAVREKAYASSFLAAKSKANLKSQKAKDKDKSGEKPKSMSQPILKRIKTEQGTADYVFYTEPRIKAKIDNKYELDFELTDINGNMLSRDAKAYKEGDLFIYEDIKKGIDARTQFTGSGFASELKLKKFISIKSIEYSIRTSLEAKLIDNEVIFYDSKHKEKEIFVIGKPYMYEKNNPKKANGDISYSLTKTYDGWVLTKALPAKALMWLNDPGRSYPVILDPTVNSVIQTGIDNTIESRWESPARKVAYMPNATGGAAWYSTHTDGGSVVLEKCKVSTNCDATADWTVVSSQLDTADSDTDNRNTTVWKHGDVLYVAWFDNNRDSYQFTTIDTASSDSQGTICAGSDKGSAIDVYISIAVAADGDVYISLAEHGTGDGTADLEGQSRVASGGCTETDIQTGSGIDQNDSVEVLTIGNNAFFVHNDNTGLRLSVYVDDGSPGWDTSSMDLNGGTADNDNSDLSAVTDGTDIWVFQRNGTTGNSDLYKCSSCPTTSQTFNALTDPWSAGDFSSSGHVGLSYLSSANEIMAVMVDDQAGTGNYHIRSKKTNADSISWQSEFEFDIGSQNIAIEYFTMTAVVPTSDQAAVVYLDNTNSEFEFSTVPESFYLLLVFLPIFIYGKRFIYKKSVP